MKLSREELTPDILHQLVVYDKESGEFTWKDRPASMFVSEQSQKAFRVRHLGKPAFTVVDYAGYRAAVLLGVPVRAHRVAYAMTYGKWPPEHIDHIDGDKSNNRISNLRSVAPWENGRNKIRMLNNTSGVTGAWWSENLQRWVAEVGLRGSKIFLGQFKTLAEAEAARRAAKAILRFTERHGEHPDAKAAAEAIADLANQEHDPDADIEVPAPAERIEA